MSTINVKNIQYPAGTGDITIPSGTNLVSSVSGAIRAPGIILQVVQTNTSLSATTSSLSYASTGLTATITPKSSASRILVLIQIMGCGNNSVTNGIGFAIYRNGSVVYSPYQADVNGPYGYFNQTGSNVWQTQNLMYVDSPASTAAQTYQIYWRAYSASAVYLGGVPGVITPGQHTITLMEIAG
jgi:hypothetical protein